jgi:hypothetical protein
MTAVEYLDAPIGVTLIEPTSEGINASGAWYTPRKLIKWVANKEGSSHFDPKIPAALRHLNTGLIVEGTVSMVDSNGTVVELSQNDALPVRMALIQISQWATACAESVLDAC